MKHPYIGLPDRQFWNKEAGVSDRALLDPVSNVPFRISRDDKIVTAGSCFAQHVARHLTGAGFNHYITETAHPIIPSDLATEHNYGMFAARYGNIYTARQLRQLLQRAFGEFEPITKAWRSRNGDGVADPFRPQIQPGDFLSAQEVHADRQQHFRCIRDAFTQMDVFIFTLGLTEGWEDLRDRAVFPVAPGVAGGDYDPEIHGFVNFGVDETYDDLSNALQFIRTINPSAKIILTVSPVALNATFEDRHVLLSTTLSKSVLRIAAEKAVNDLSDCVYFPSYEVITSPHARGAYFADNCREVTPRGVEHVMKLFFTHFTDQDGTARADDNDTSANQTVAQHMQDMQHKIDVLCDEAEIDNIDPDDP